MFIGELSMITERGHIRYQARSNRPHRTPNSRQRMSLHDFNWAEPNTGEVLLRLWDAHHGLQPGDYIEIDRDVGTSRSSLFWCGYITEVAGHMVYLGKTELRRLTEPCRLPISLRTRPTLQKRGS